jgi:hypothetical protein
MDLHSVVTRKLIVLYPITLLLLCIPACFMHCSTLQAASSAAPSSRRSANAQFFPRPAIWCLYQGKTLKQALNSWSQRAGWTLQWEFRHDYPIVITTCFKGSFSQALQAVTRAYEPAEHPFYLDLYPQQRLAIVGH